MNRLFFSLIFTMLILSCSENETEPNITYVLPNKVLLKSRNAFESSEINFTYSENKIISVNDLKFNYTGFYLSKIEPNIENKSTYAIYEFEYDNEKLKTFYKYSYYNNDLIEVLKNEITYTESNIVVNIYASIEPDDFSSFSFDETVTLEKNNDNISRIDFYPTFKNFHNMYSYTNSASVFKEIQNFDILQIVSLCDKNSNAFFEMFGLCSKGINNVISESINVNNFTNEASQFFEYKYEFTTNSITKIEINTPNSTTLFKELIFEY